MARNVDSYGIDHLAITGGELARLTHRHPLGWLSACIFVQILFKSVLYADNIKKDEFKNIISDSILRLRSLRIFHPIIPCTWDKSKSYGEVFDLYITYLDLIIKKAILFAESGMSDLDGIHKIGKGWVAEEVLAIAIFCVLRHFGDFEGAVVASVNHDGNSNSTGVITGNIIGAMVGYNSIPKYYKTDLELRDLILSVAQDLYTGCIINEYDPIDTLEKKQWLYRYVKNAHYHEYK